MSEMKHLLLIAVILLAGILAGGQGFALSGSLAGSPEYDAEKISLGIHKYINLERGKEGLSVMKWNPALSEIAISHSMDMVENGFFSHTSPTRGSFSDRYEHAGFTCRVKVANVYYAGAENLYTSFTYARTYYSGGKIVKREWLSDDALARQAVLGWMNSKGHRENILTSHWLSEGIGVFISPEGEVLITQNFC
jgi:uncharacterized protein YkwD